MSDAPEPEFGPSGYLPERAARRARKIMLRAPLGLQWVVASLVAGVVLLVAGLLFLRSSATPPGEPWTPIGPVAEVGASRVEPGLDLLLVGAGGRVRAFADAPGVAYCPASNRLESPDGRVWTLTGRGLGGTLSLVEHPTLVHAGILYVDLTRLAAQLSPATEPTEPACWGPTP